MENEIKLMQQWAEDNYSNGADTLVECWSTEDYAALFESGQTVEQAWATLKAVVSVYKERQADAYNLEF